jgi:lipid-binding SYLF domain-containing protein
LFAGINLSGGVLRADGDDNADLYGKGAVPKDIVMNGVAKAPAVTDSFMAALRRGK